MNKTYFTPGPTELYPNAKKDLSDALDKKIFSLNHRSIEFMEIFKNTVSSLKTLMNIPENYHVFFLSSATECMDRIIQNCTVKNTFHFANGAFADRFYKTAVELGRNAVKSEVDYGSSFNFDDIKIDNDPEVICITQNETSTGVAIDVQNIYDLKIKYPDSIIAVDIVTSAPNLNIDFSKIDCAFFSVQKGFGLPAGLGVLILNDRCLQKAEKLKSDGIKIGSYHNFISLLENELMYQTTETPNMPGIYLLGKVCEQLNEKGISEIRKETEEKSDMLYNFFNTHRSFTLFVKNTENRSKTIIVIETGSRQVEVKKLLSENGIIVGSGYGKFKTEQIRIANFPMHKKEDVLKIINTLKHLD